MGMPAVEMRRWTAAEVQALPEEPGIGNRALVLPAPLDYVLDTFTVVQPDITVVPTPNGRAPKRDEESEPPVLFIEILSPSTARYDRVVKRRRYQREGVEYWIVDIDSRLIERWQGEGDRPEVLTELLTWKLEGHTDVFALEIETFFARVSGES